MRKAIPLVCRFKFSQISNMISETFKQWEVNLNICAENMMKMLIDNYKVMLTEIYIKIEKLYVQIQPLLKTIKTS